MQNLKKSILKAIKSKKIHVFVLFVLISAVILFIAKLSKTYTYTTPLKVNAVNLPESRVVVGDTTKTVSVTLRGTGFRLIRMYLNKPLLHANLETVTADSLTKTYTWPTKFAESELIDRYSSEIEVISVQPETVEYEYDQFFEKEVAIKLDASIGFQRGFDMFNTPQISPSHITIIGSEQVLNTIDSVETRFFELTNINSSVTKQVQLNLPDVQLYKVMQKAVEVTIKAEKFTEGDVTVPVEIINVPDTLSLTYFPKQISVSFYTSLSRYNRVKPNQFRVVAEYKTRKPNISILPLHLVKQSDSVKRVQLKQKQIEYILNK